MFAGDEEVLSREAEAHHLRGTLLAALHFFPNFSAAHRVSNRHPYSPSNGCPSRVDELVKVAALMLKYENESGQARRGAMSSCVMVHLTLLYCSTTSTSAELVAVRRQAAMCVLAQATRAPAPQATLCLAERLSCSELLHVLGARRKPLAPTKLAMS